ncbi:MAG: histidine phosphatase family protein [Rubrivivax sp.]
MQRRTLMLIPLAAAPWAALAQPAASASAAALPETVTTPLRAGGVVLALRHALAPGTFDPPGFRLDDCRSQRNLDEQGRAQARRLGAMLRAAGLQPSRLRSSPWCRCRDTATLAFGEPEVWDALGSPRGSDGASGPPPDQTARLRRGIADVARAGRGFEAWITHQFVLADLTGEATASGAGLVLTTGDGGRTVRVLARLSPP